MIQMTNHSIELRPQTESIWKGDHFSYVSFAVTYPSQETRELFHDSSVIKLAAFLFLRTEYSSHGSKVKDQDERRIACNKLELQDALVFDFNGDEPSSNQPLPYDMALKLSTLFSSAQPHSPCLIVRTHKDIFDGEKHFDACRLQIFLEVKRHFPTNYSIYHHCKNFFSPIVSNTSTKTDTELDHVDFYLPVVSKSNMKSETEHVDFFSPKVSQTNTKSDTEHIDFFSPTVPKTSLKSVTEQVEEDIMALSCEDMVGRWWSQVGDEELVLSIEALSNSNEPSIISGLSQYVQIFEYKLCVEHMFTGNTQVKTLHGSRDVEWDASSTKSKLDIMVSLKNGKGEIYHNYPKSVPVTVELLYEDGTEAPTFPIGSRKKRNGVALPLLHALSSFPIFSPGIGSQIFTFRIEQTSSRHKNHRGFRLKVSVKNGYRDDILQCITDDVIVVIRKARRKSSLSDDIPIVAPSLSRLLNSDDSNEQRLYESPLALCVPQNKIKQLFTGNGGRACLSCNADLAMTEGTSIYDHYPNCRLAVILSPYIVPSNDGFERLLAEGATLCDFIENLDNVCIPCETSNSIEPCDSFMEKLSRVVKQEGCELYSLNSANADLESVEMSPINAMEISCEAIEAEGDKIIFAVMDGEYISKGD